MYMLLLFDLFILLVLLPLSSHNRRIVTATRGRNDGIDRATVGRAAAATHRCRRCIEIKVRGHAVVAVAAAAAAGAPAGGRGGGQCGSTTITVVGLCVFVCFVWWLGRVSKGVGRCGAAARARAHTNDSPGVGIPPLRPPRAASRGRVGPAAGTTACT